MPKATSAVTTAVRPTASCPVLRRTNEGAPVVRAVLWGRAGPLSVRSLAMKKAKKDWEAKVLAVPGAAERVAEEVIRLQAGIRGFAAEMREKGIHVGMRHADKVLCVTCDEPWPCAGSKG